MAGGELRRSYTQMEFSMSRVRPNMPHMFQQPPIHQVRDHRRRFSAMPANRVKHPTLDIYRPPSVRMEGANGTAVVQRSLNVHAPEFTMNNKIQTSRSTTNVMMNGFGIVESQGYGSAAPGQQLKSYSHTAHAAQPAAALVATATGTGQKAVHFQESVVVKDNLRPTHSTLKRSKSLSSTLTLPALPTTSPDIGSFTAEIQTVLQQAIIDPNEIPARSLMSLAKQIVERALSDRRYAIPAAKICINVIEKEKKETFLESLLNTCQQTYEQRDKLLRSQSFGSRYLQYMNFLNEMYVQFKRSQLQLKTQYDGVAPQMLMLTLLSKCFVDCLKQTPFFRIEIESIFFILTSIGKDLEHDLPKAIELIFFNIRDVFLAATTPAQIKTTLLQLIELRASKWQLNASAVMYYYPLSHGNETLSKSQ